MDRQTHAAHSDGLNAFVDGTLSADERSHLQSLIAGNPEMERELAELQATARLMNRLPEYTPRRSFRLGEEHAKASPPPAQGKILQFLPIVRTLSVAAALIFMVVAGSLFFDINGNIGGGSGTSLQQGGEIPTGETESNPGSSDGAEDASGGNGSSMTSRGDAASVGDEPMEDLTQLEQNAGAAGSPMATSGDEDRGSWIWSSVAFGGLALVLAGLWFTLAKAGRQASASHS